MESEAASLCSIRRGEQSDEMIIIINLFNRLFPIINILFVVKSAAAVIVLVLLPLIDFIRLIQILKRMVVESGGG